MPPYEPRPQGGDRQPTMETVHETPTSVTAQTAHSKPSAGSRQTAQNDRSYAKVARLPTHGSIRRHPTSNTITSHGLAGPPANDHHNQAFFEHGYEQANPWMQQEDDGPGFSLAGNFPRTIRWQNKRPGFGRHPTVQPDQQGQTEPAPQMEATDEMAVGDDHDPVDDAESVGEAEEIKRQKREDRQSGGEASLEPQNTSQCRSSNALPPGMRPFNPWAKFRMKFQRPLAEFLGMSVFMFLGVSANLSVYVSQQQSGSQQTVWWTWGFAVMIGIYIAGGTSGGFLNPMLLVMLSIFRGFPARRIPAYLLAQVLGGFVGALLAFALQRDAIINLDGALLPETTGVNFYTQPQADYISVSTAFCTEMLGSAVMACAILALGDSGNSPPGAGMHALIIGLLVTTICMALGWTTRGCFNPARDLGPRLAALAVGYPLHSFTDWKNFWIWGAWVAPMVGGIIGGIAYDGCIFKGGESPVNYSGTLWKRKGIQKEGEFFDRVLHNHRKARDLTRKLEAGELENMESRVKKESVETSRQRSEGALSSRQPPEDMTAEDLTTEWLDRRFQNPY